jgi:hypothetical protein
LEQSAASSEAAVQRQAEEQRDPEVVAVLAVLAV